MYSSRSPHYKDPSHIIIRTIFVASRIQLNTNFRTLAKDKFEKNLFKLMNNNKAAHSIWNFGKTIEDMRNYIDVRLNALGREISNILYSIEAIIAKSNFRTVFSENLITIKIRKMKFDKSIYVGMCILDISKTYLYEFYHEYMTPLLRENCKVMYTDTDSLIYHIKCDDITRCISLNPLFAHRWH